MEKLIFIDVHILYDYANNVQGKYRNQSKINPLW